jgi:hypothetical protein
MRLNSLFAIGLAVSLGACADAASCLVDDGAEQQACASRAIQYTSAAPQAEPARVLPVHIDQAFNIYERAKILRAVNEWNVALNGQIRLEVSPTALDATPYLAAGARRPEGWTVARIDSRSPILGSSAMNRALAVTVGTRRAIVYVVADRLGTRDLGSIMMHEFGHAFGLGHDSGSDLMHPYYTGDKQRCIDKGAVRAVAAAQNLDFSRLNWCRGTVERTSVAAAPRGSRAAWTSLRNH